MSNLQGRQASLIIDALRLYQRQKLDDQGIDIDDLCEQLNFGDIALVDTVKPLQSYHLLYSYVDPQGEVVSDCDWGCEAEDLNHAVEQLVNDIEGGNSGNNILAVQPVGDHADEPVPVLRQDDEDVYHLIGMSNETESLQAYVRVGNVDVRIAKTDEGVVVDLYDRNSVAEPIGSTYAHFSECAMDEDDDLVTEKSSNPGLSQ